MARMGWMWMVVVVTVVTVGAVQEWEEEPGYKEVNPGGEVVMSCLVRHKRGECRWERDNTPIAAFPGKYEWAGSREQGDCSLRILIANFDYDNGGWVCQVTASSFRERDTLISQPASLVVRAPPTSVHLVKGSAIVEEGAEVVGVAGEGVALECRALGGNPPPALRWRVAGTVRDGAKEHIDPETGVTVSRLQLEVARADQGAAVACEAVHPAIEGTMVARARLQVQYAPLVSVTPALPSYVEGDTVELTCSAEAMPPAGVLWYRAGSGEIVSRLPQLRLPALTREQAGQYVCRANNTVGTSQPGAVDIAVQYGPTILALAPALHLHKLLRSKLELSCDASGSPAPSYSWLQHTEEGAVVRGDGARLIIPSLGYRDQGRYECRAMNTIRGEQLTANSQHIELNVTGPPRMREEASELSVVRGSDALVRVEFCADPLPKLTWQLVGLEGDQSRTILSPGTEHDRFRVLAEEAGSREDCYLSTLRIQAADLGDSRDYVLNLENEHGNQQHVVAVTVREALALHTLVGGVVGGLATLLLLVLALCCCRQSCCRREKPLKQDIESHGGWSSQSDVSISTEGSRSEVSTGTQGTQGTHVSLPVSRPTTDHLSVSQECIKPSGGGGLHSPSPSSDSRPPSHLSQVSYNDLCFPKTSNYGSMRKAGRCEVVGRLEERQVVGRLEERQVVGRLEERQRQLGPHGPPHRALHLHSNL